MIFGHEDGGYRAGGHPHANGSTWIALASGVVASGGRGAMPIDRCQCNC
jgi:hypothetical protein